MLENLARRGICFYQRALRERGIPPGSSELVLNGLDSGGVRQALNALGETISNRAQRQLNFFERSRGKDLRPHTRKTLQKGLTVLFAATTPFETGIRLFTGNKGERALTHLYTHFPIVDWVGGGSSGSTREPEDDPGRVAQTVYNRAEVGAGDCGSEYWDSNWD